MSPFEPRNNLTRTEGIWKNKTPLVEHRARHRRIRLSVLRLLLRDRVFCGRLSVEGRRDAVAELHKRPAVQQIVGRHGASVRYFLIRLAAKTRRGYALENRYAIFLSTFSTDHNIPA